MRKAMMCRNRSVGSQDVVNDTILPSESSGTERCAVCLKEFKAKHIVNDISRRRRYCSRRCRLRAWALRDLVRALTAGQADGLRDKVGVLVSAHKKASGSTNLITEVLHNLDEVGNPHNDGKKDR